MTKVKVWDPFIRIFHWSLAVLFVANALFIDPNSALHDWVGYAILGLVMLRLLWGFVGPHTARFASFPPSISGIYEQLTEIATRRVVQRNGHTPLGALMIYNLLITLVVICGSGIALSFGAGDWAEEIHEVAVGWAEISVLVHIAAVLFESYRTQENLPRAMVTGYKDRSDEKS